MGLFGRQGCNEDRSWLVKLWLIDKSHIVLVEQFANKEAKKFFGEAKKVIENSKGRLVEFEVGERKYCFIKDNIVGIGLETQ